MTVRRHYEPHNCREHILVRHGVNGAGAQHVCSVCRKPVSLRLRGNQVLARNPA